MRDESPDELGARDAAHDPARGPEGRRDPDRLQPRALHPRAARASAIEVQRPASGLVTALEPVMRACSGTWIAHGAGSADREVVDANDHVMVPPEKPAYRIRRVWLTKEEEAGYYYGFANEGLWPLCHIAHTRPVFRASDWEHYRAVNRRFAEAVVAESRTANPIVLVQDYHFALLPRMIRERLPEATIITFWHIPWPNPEAFGICPWRTELLEGLLGSSILGFHTQFHCNNFFDTVDRYLEARVDRETFTISYGGEPTEVHRYPISIEWPPAALAAQPPVAECRDGACASSSGCAPDVRARRGRRPPRLHQGHPRALRRGRALLELEPRWIGQASRSCRSRRPSRSSIDEYQSLDARVRAAAQRINDRFGSRGLPADRAQDRAPRRRRASTTLLPRRRLLLRLQPARRHEPGGQGIRRRARRRARRADAVAVRGRGARAAGGAHRQPLRHRAVRRGPAARRSPCRPTSSARACAACAACCRSSTSTAGPGGCCSTRRACATAAASRRGAARRRAGARRLTRRGSGDNRRMKQHAADERTRAAAGSRRWRGCGRVPRHRRHAPRARRPPRRGAHRRARCARSSRRLRRGGWRRARADQRPRDRRHRRAVLAGALRGRRPARRRAPRRRTGALHYHAPLAAATSPRRPRGCGGSSQRAPGPAARGQGREPRAALPRRAARSPALVRARGAARGRRAGRRLRAAGRQVRLRGEAQRQGQGHGHRGVHGARRPSPGARRCSSATTSPTSSASTW